MPVEKSIGVMYMLTCSGCGKEETFKAAFAVPGGHDGKASREEGALAEADRLAMSAARQGGWTESQHRRVGEGWDSFVTASCPNCTGDVPQEGEETV